MGTIAFTKVALAYGWLGNMSPHRIEAGGYTWRTGEALFQAMRFDDVLIQQEIREQEAPMMAKWLARRHAASMVVPPRSEEDVDNMLIVLRLKLKQHPRLRRDLLVTGDATIIEDCSARRSESGLFWGAALQDGAWVGENRLGKLWMKLRGDLVMRRRSCVVDSRT